MKFNLSKLTPQQFEEVCYHILEANKFTQLQWYGKLGGDKGRDILAVQIESPLPNIKRESKWIIQCKRYLHKQPSKTDISDFLNSCREHDPNKVLLIYSCTIKANMKDWLDKVSKQYSFQIFYWEEKDIYREIENHRTHIAKHFPNLLKTGKRVNFYHTGSCETDFHCNEYDEAVITILNQDDYNSARKMAQDFIDFIKNNNITIDNKDYSKK